MKNLINANLLNNLWRDGVSPLKIALAGKLGIARILKTQEEFDANTDENNIPGALLLKDVLGKISESITISKDLPTYELCPVLDESTTKLLKVDLSGIHGYQNLSVNDIYPFFTYKAVYGNSYTAPVSYDYDSNLGVLSILTTSDLLYKEQSVRVVVNPTYVYELPLVYVSPTECYVDLTSVPDYQKFNTRNISIKVSEIFNFYSNGYNNTQYLYYDSEEGKLYYRGLSTSFASMSRSVYVAIKLLEGSNESYPENTISFKVIDGKLYWKEQGADTWSPFMKSKTLPDIQFIGNHGGGSDLYATWTFDIPQTLDADSIIVIYSVNGTQGNVNMQSAIGQRGDQISEPDLVSIQDILPGTRIKFYLWYMGDGDYKLQSITVNVSTGSQGGQGYISASCLSLS